MNTNYLFTVLPAKYAKFLASLTGALILYLDTYGPVWHLVPAATFAAASLGVLATPNKSPVVQAAPVAAPAAAPVQVTQ